MVSQQSLLMSSTWMKQLLWNQTPQKQKITVLCKYLCCSKYYYSTRWPSKSTIVYLQYVPHNEVCQDYDCDGDNSFYDVISQHLCFTCINNAVRSNNNECTTLINGEP